MGSPKILFIHGAGGTSSKWRNVEPYFSSYTVESVNLPGRSDGDNAVNTIQEHAQKINDLITEETIVVGHSMGGLVGLELAKQNDNVKGLILAASFYELPVHPKMLASFDEGEFPNSLFYASYTKNVDEELISQESKEKDIVPIRTVQKDFHACNAYKDGAQALSNLEIPVLAIYGNADRLLPTKMGESLKNVNRNIQLVEMDGGSHYLILEEPEQFSNKIKEFIKKL